VKNLKILIMLCGAALLVMMVTDGLGAQFEADKVNTLIMLAAFALPTLMGLMGLMKPPMQAWQAGIALAGFGVAAVRGRIWETLPKIADYDGKGKAGLILLAVGVVVSALALAKPESSS
jgi:Na+/melibiose symporter-like transporter